MTRSKVIGFLIFVIVTLIVLAGIAVLIIYGASKLVNKFQKYTKYLTCLKLGKGPCIFEGHKCNTHAKCFNYPFKAKCICDYGYAGNGIEYCDGILNW